MLSLQSTALPTELSNDIKIILCNNVNFYDGKLFFLINSVLISKNLASRAAFYVINI